MRAESVQGVPVVFSGTEAAMPGSDKRSPARCVGGGGRAIDNESLRRGDRSATNGPWQARRARIVAYLFIKQDGAEQLLTALMESRQ